MVREYVNRKGMLTVGDRFENKTTGTEATVGMQVPVRVVDVRTSFGREDILVVPKCGTGSEWFSASRFQPVDEWPPDNAEIQTAVTPEPDDACPVDPDLPDPLA